MIMPHDKKYHGKYKLDSKRAKTGRVTIPAKLASLSSFPFKPHDTIHISLRENAIVLEKQNHGIDPILVDRQCMAVDCDNNLYGKCGVKSIISDKGMCTSYLFNRNKFNVELKKKMSEGLNDSKTK